MFLVDQAILTVESVSVLLHFQGIKWQVGNLLPRNTENSPSALCLCTAELYSPVQVSIQQSWATPRMIQVSGFETVLLLRPPGAIRSMYGNCLSHRYVQLQQFQLVFLQAFIWMFNGSTHRVSEYDVEWINICAVLCSCLVYSYGNTIIL